MMNKIEKIEDLSIIRKTKKQNGLSDWDEFQKQKKTRSKLHTYLFTSIPKLAELKHEKAIQKKPRKLKTIYLEKTANDKNVLNQSGEKMFEKAIL